MFNKKYLFGGVLFEINTPTPYEDRSPYTQFLASPKYDNVEPDVRYDFVYSDYLPVTIGELQYKDDNVRIIHDGEWSYRYAGHYSPTEKCFVEYACSVGHAECNHNNYTVYLLKEYAGKLFNSLVFGSFGIGHSMAQESGMILHSSFIEYKSKAILFTAPKGTGKSTQARLWQAEKGARIINGDRTLIRAINGKLYAHGVPYAGTSKICLNKSYPLAVVVELTQAKENKVSMLSGVSAFKALYKNIWLNTWCKYDVDKVSALAVDIAENIAVCRLDCRPNEDAVEVLYNLISKYIK